jgi:hypothetical protein
MKMLIERYKSLDALKVAKPELVKATRHQILEATLALSKEGIASSGVLIEGHWRQDIRGGKRTWVQDFLYENHSHESRIRFEFRYEWAHEDGRPMGKEVGEVLRDKLIQIPNAVEVLTMFGHYGRDVSSTFVLVWIARKDKVQFTAVSRDGTRHYIIKEKSFEELWGFDPKTGRTV